MVNFALIGEEYVWEPRNSRFGQIRHLTLRPAPLLLVRV